MWFSLCKFVVFLSAGACTPNADFSSGHCVVRVLYQQKICHTDTLHVTCALLYESTDI